MDCYDHRKANLWKEAYKNDPTFSYDNTPTAKVISFFSKRKANDPEINLTKEYIEKEVDFDIIVNVQWVQHHLDRKITYTRKWYDYNIYLLGGLQLYMDQCELGGYNKCLLSKAEYMAIKPKIK